MIDQPIETIFAFITDVQQILRVMQVDKGESIAYRFFGVSIVLKPRTAQIKESRQTSSGPLHVGTTFVQVYALPGGSSETTFQITQYDPPRVIACKFRGGVDPLGEVRVVLAPVAAGTRVTEIIKLEGGCTKLARLFLAPLVKRQVEINMRQMKARLVQVCTAKWIK